MRGRCLSSVGRQEGAKMRDRMGERNVKVPVVGAGAQGRDQCLGLQSLTNGEIVTVADRSPLALDRLGQQVSHLPQL